MLGAACDCALRMSTRDLTCCWSLLYSAVTNLCGEREMEPGNLKYTEDHIWVAVDGKEARIGITDHAQKELADVVFVELPKAGTQLTRGETFGTIESVKSVADLVSPVTGKVTGANDLLTDKPDTVNTDPYDQGWIVTIELDKPNELNELMDYSAYQKHIQG